MRAAVYERYGPPEEVLAVRDVPEPELTGEHDVLVRVGAASVGMGDWRLLVADPLAVRFYQGIVRLKRPVLGHAVAGVVERVGPAVTDLAPGERVFGESSDAGGFAELVRLRERDLARTPDAVADEVAAAATVPGYAALHGLRDKGRIAAGHRVLVVGAGGAVGTAAVQLARHFGAHVTAVDGASKRAFVEDLGVDAFLDRRAVDWTATGERWDLVLDMVGNAPVRACRRALTPTGRYVAVSGPLRRTAWLSLFGGPRMVALFSTPDPDDLELLRGWLADGTLAPTIARTYPLDETAAALRAVGEGGLRGAVVVRPRAGTADELQRAGRRQ